MTENWPKLLLETGGALAYLGALIFIAGFSYADRYFFEFGLNLSAVDGMGNAAFSAYAFWVLQDWLLFLLCLVSVIVVIGVRPGTHIIRTLLALSLAVAFLLLAAFAGKDRATGQARSLIENGWHNFQRVQLHPKDADGVLSAFLSQSGYDVNPTCLRKLFMDRKNIYVYQGFESVRHSKPSVYIIPLSEIAVIETITNPGLCPG